jgi:deoxyribodipyrimidine photolyase-related protein
MPVLGDRLISSLSALASSTVTAAVGDQATHVRHHKKKVARIFPSMRNSAAALVRDVWRVVYRRYDGPMTSRSMCRALMRRYAGSRPTA